jgi:hypothetical protein
MYQTQSGEGASVTLVRKDVPSSWAKFETFTGKLKTVAEAVAVSVGLATVFSAGFGAFLIWQYISRIRSVFGSAVPFPPLDASVITLMTLLVAVFLFVMFVLCCVFFAAALTQNGVRDQLVDLLPDLYFEPKAFWRENQYRRARKLFWRKLGKGALQHSTAYLPPFLIVLATAFALARGELNPSVVFIQWFPIGVLFWIFLLLLRVKTHFVPGLQAVMAGVWINLSICLD